MPLAGGLGELMPTRNLWFQFTLFQPGGANYAHYTTACPPGLENVTASLHWVHKLMKLHFDFEIHNAKEFKCIEVIFHKDTKSKGGR